MSILRKILSEKQITALRYLTVDPVVEEVLYGGAAGGGKTVLGSHFQINNRLEFPGSRGLIGRESKLDIRNTTLRTFDEVYGRFWHKFGIRYRFLPQDHILEFSNGSLIFLRDLRQTPKDPDFLSLGGLEVTDAFVDEVGEVSEKAVTVLKSRIRYRLNGRRPKLLMATNPTRNWPRLKYVRDKDNKPKILEDKYKYVQALLSDNPDKDFVKSYTETLESLPSYDRDRLLYGDWDAVERILPFFFEFLREKHVKVREMDRMEDITISFDFNIHPTTAHIGQKDTLVVKETIQIDGGTEKLCDAIIERGWLRWPGGVTVTGDSNGISGSSAAGVEPDGRHVSDFGIIQRKFDLPSHAFVEAFEANKRHKYSRTLCNYAFKHLPIAIDPSCHVLIQDLETGQEKPDGGILKNREGHKQDAGDAFRYLINSWFPYGLDDVDAMID